MNQELATIDSLLRDSTFALSMAAALDSAYYVGIGQTPPEFLNPAEANAIVMMTVKDEKLATNLAGFYALECGLGLLCYQSKQTPVQWLEKITNGTADTNAILLLNRFANATWKAGQPFRGLSRIYRPNFRVAGLLSADEIQKDYVQVSNAARKLLTSLDSVKTGATNQQMQTIRQLLQSPAYAVEMANYLDSSYAASQKLESRSLLAPGDDTATIPKHMKEMKIATSIAGFYALECAVNYLAEINHELPSKILRSLASGTISKDDAMIFARFANSTWKAGQPFRGLGRITRETFTPFYFLNEGDIEKDLVQVKAAARKLLPML